MSTSSKSNVYTPFERRFTDERAISIGETRALHDRVGKMHAQSDYADDEYCYCLAESTTKNVAAELPNALKVEFFEAIYTTFRMEKPVFEMPAVDFSLLTLKAQVDLNRFLRSKEHYLHHEETLSTLLIGTVYGIFEGLAKMLPQALDPSPFTIPLIYALPDPKGFIDELFSALIKDELKDNGLFVDLFNQLYLNLCEVSGISDPHEPKKPFLRAKDNPAPLSDILKGYLKETPFAELFLTPVPLKLTHEVRFSHMHVLGGSGAGKTQLLQSLILHDLKSAEPPALVIVDSQGDLISKISKLDLFRERDLVLITPKDIKYPPALNIFDVNRQRFGQYDEYTKEQVVAGVIQTFDYLFSGLIGADLTAKQGVFFRYIARMLLALPETMGRNATILDIIRFIDNPEEYRETINTLPELARNFFERDLLDPKKKTFAETKEQVRYRLQAILENPTLARLFTAPETRIDLFTELNKGSVILVDTAKDFLKGASSHFGRIFISLVLQAVLERAVVSEHERRDAFLIVDEAASYFDTNINDLLTEARKYRLGCVFAHQYLEQCTPALRASFAANTAIKMAAGVSTADARSMAPEMRTTPDFILSQPRLTFACHIRNVTPQAVGIPLEVGKMEREPQLDAEALEALQKRNRERVSIPKDPPRTPDAEVIPPEAPKSPPPEKDSYTEW